MFSFIKGTITHASDQVVTVYSESLGLGWEITANRACAARLNQIVSLHVYVHWNQEQGPSLYGFETRAERECFILLIGCPGVGPKLALSLLEQIDLSALATIVQANDVKALSALKGIGLKKAEQLILYLKNKIDDFMAQYAPTGTAGSAFKQVAQVLESLNYGQAEIQQTLAHLHQQQLGTLPFDALLRKALAFLVKKV
jgi:Holliday junction DNA helicase RuvA